MDNREVNFKCCICGKQSVGYGHNPWPVSDNQEDRCCDFCNFTKVIPARLKEKLGE
jgi:hypothetical protein